MVCRLPEGRMGWHEIGGRCQVPKYFKRDWTTETTCFRTLFRTVTFHRHLFYILYIVFHQIYSNCIITKCKSWQWIAWKYALFLEKNMHLGGCVCFWIVRLGPALQKPLAKLRRATSGLRRNLHTRSANLFLPATASPPVFVLLSDRFSSHFPGCSFDV